MKPLTPQELSTLRTLARVLVPPTDTLRYDPDMIDFNTPMLRFFEAMDEGIARNLRRLLYVFEMGTYVLHFASKPFSKMSPELQKQYVRSWAESKFYPKRALFEALKLIVVLIVTSQPTIEAQIGYSPHQTFDGISP